MKNELILFGENSIKEAFDVIEKKFAKDFEGCTPVSYTHLDVYKRQVQWA